MFNINKATLYLLSKNKDTLVNVLIVALLAAGILLAINAGYLDVKSNAEIVLIVYVLLLGMTLIVSNSMIIDLTVKDKLSNRIEFFIASEIKFKDLVMSYSIQMLRLSSIVPFACFIGIYYFIDLNYSFGIIVAMYMTTVLLAFSEIIFLNVISFFAKKYKLFKNMVFFGTFFVIYISGIYSNQMVTFLYNLGIDIIAFIILFNLVVSIALGASAYIRLKKVNNEMILQQRGEWV